MNKQTFVILLLLSASLSSCGVTRINSERNLQLKVLDEYIIPPQTYFDGEEIGGLSGIDYHEGKLLLLDDRSTRPIIYEVDLLTQGNRIDTLVFQKAINLKKTDSDVFGPKSMDLESVRFDPENIDLYWVANEGNINAKKDPGVYQVTSEGKFIQELQLPEYWKAASESAPRNNGVFEAMDFSFDKKKLVVTTELPLREDGPKPRLWKTFSPVRFIEFDLKNLQAERAYIYDLDRIVKWPLLPFMINGVTEILAYSEHQYFVIERAFSAGRGRKSNRIKLFLASTENASDVLQKEQLSKRKNYYLMTKELILDFKKIRKKLPSKHIDNIEGVCYGPELANGNKTLLFVSDNNFNSFIPQITQIIWLEIIE